MRMSFADTDPDHRWTIARIEDSHPAQRQKKRWHPHLAQSLTQPILGWCLHSSEKAQRQMKLFLGKPAQTWQLWVKFEQRRLKVRRKFETNKQPFRAKHLQSYLDRISASNGEEELRSQELQELQNMRVKSLSENPGRHLPGKIFAKLPDSLA